MNRFFEEEISGNVIKLNRENENHAKNVLRVKNGEKIIVCDGRGNDFLCAVMVEKAGVFAEILSVSKNETEPPYTLTVFQSILKSDKTEFVIQKCVELGACRIVPFLSERTVSRPKDLEERQNRYQKVAEAAAKQCGRGIIPKVERVLEIGAAISSAKTSCENIAVAYENEKGLSIKGFIAGKTGSLGVFVGPEGGFSDKEAGDFAKAEIPAVSLGKLILRAETAAVAVSAFILYEYM
ncbi:ribosomal RNA small subunit methyltransferase E [Clostridia bacterium]|nr:ribosomal RNA small subunit methyltransferase E [Clostridia bacterium]